MQRGYFSNEGMLKRKIQASDRWWSQYQVESGSDMLKVCYSTATFETSPYQNNF
jgi:hypothetical protein